MSKAVNIITSNKLLYKKLNSLHFCNEVMLEKNETKFINRILNNINFKRKDIKMEKIGNRIKLIKINPINLNLFLKNK